MAEVIDFYSKRLSENSILKVFSSDDEALLFETDLGKSLFRKEGDNALVFNRDVRVQYKYTGNKTLNIEAYIFLGNIATVSFPPTKIIKNNLLHFEMKAETRVYEQDLKPKRDPKFIWRQVFITTIISFATLWFVWITWRSL